MSDGVSGHVRTAIKKILENVERECRCMTEDNWHKERNKFSWLT